MADRPATEDSALAVSTLPFVVTVDDVARDYAWCNRTRVGVVCARAHRRVRGG